MSGDGHERELGSHQLPDNLVGIGGVGKAVVDRFLSEEWIVEEAVGATGGRVPVLTPVLRLAGAPVPLPLWVGDLPVFATYERLVLVGSGIGLRLRRRSR